MFRKTIAAALMIGLTTAWAGAQEKDADGFYPLFNGKDLAGWTPTKENSGSFQVKDGVLIVDGPRAHLFYSGPVARHDFKNFEYKVKVMITPGSNSGLYFHTAYQDNGWPNKGYEAQVNNTHQDPKKTGGLYGVQDVMNDSPVKDNVWFDYYIKVQGKQIVIKINDKTTVDYTEPDGLQRGGRVLSSGTFAIQAHDPKSVVHYKDIRVKPLD